MSLIDLKGAVDEGVAKLAPLMEAFLEALPEKGKEIFDGLTVEIHTTISISRKGAADVSSNG